MLRMIRTQREEDREEGGGRNRWLEFFIWRTDRQREKSGKRQTIHDLHH